jgi:hypothetical protein
VFALLRPLEGKESKEEIGSGGHYPGKHRDECSKTLPRGGEEGRDALSEFDSH